LGFHAGHVDETVPGLTGYGQPGNGDYPKINRCRDHEADRGDSVRHDEELFAPIVMGG
jgi:hypothetical protein